jgi:hypothetical protein
MPFQMNGILRRSDRGHQENDAKQKLFHLRSLIAATFQAAQQRTRT